MAIVKSYSLPLSCNSVIKLATMMLAGIVHVMVRNGTGEDKRLRGEFLLHLSGELGFSGSAGRGGVLVLRWVMGVKEEM